MRMYVAVLTASALTAPAFIVTAASAQTSTGPVPAELGNRANGRDYQPTPAEVGPRERAAGIQPPAARQRANNRDLERIDKQALQEEGKSTNSVPKMTTGQ
jgi:hypothetical protein